MKEIMKKKVNNKKIEIKSSLRYQLKDNKWRLFVYIQTKEAGMSNKDVRSLLV